MAMAPYHRSYLRVRPSGPARATKYLANPACHMTDQGADPDPADLAWCIRRQWRVIYYSARRAAGLPLWQGVEDFEVLMTDVLWRLTSALTPIPPLDSREGALPEHAATDMRKYRVSQPSCRVFRVHVNHPRKWAD